MSEQIIIVNDARFQNDFRLTMKNHTAFQGVSIERKMTDERWCYLGNLKGSSLLDQPDIQAGIRCV